MKGALLPQAAHRKALLVGQEHVSGDDDRSNCGSGSRAKAKPAFRNLNSQNRGMGKSRLSLPLYRSIYIYIYIYIYMYILNIVRDTKGTLWTLWLSSRSRSNVEPGAWNKQVGGGLTGFMWSNTGFLLGDLI